MDVVVIEIPHTGIKVANTSAHVLGTKHIDDSANREVEKGEEEVHDVLICLSEQHAIFLGVDKELHLKLGGGGRHPQRSLLNSCNG